MTGRPGYTEHHPRWLRPKVSTYWWLWRWPYVKFILRELSSVAVAWFVIYLLLLVRAVTNGEAAYHQFIDWAATPAMIVVNVVTFFFIVLHAYTWFALAPQAMVVHVGKKRVPGVLIAAANYGAWIAVSAVVGWFLIGAR